MVEGDEADHPIFKRDGAAGEHFGHFRGDVRGRLDLSLAHRQDIEDRINEKSDDLALDLDDHDDMAGRRLGRGKPSRAARSTIGRTAPRRLITPRTKLGACGSAVAGVKPRISRTAMISTQNSCVPMRKAINSRPRAAISMCNSSIMSTYRREFRFVSRGIGA